MYTLPQKKRNFNLSIFPGLHGSLTTWSLTYTLPGKKCYFQKVVFLLRNSVVLHLQCSVVHLSRGKPMRLQLSSFWPNLHTNVGQMERCTDRQTGSVTHDPTVNIHKWPRKTADPLPKVRHLVTVKVHSKQKVGRSCLRGDWECLD